MASSSRGALTERGRRKILAENPFTQQGLATYEVIELAPNRGMFSSAT